MDEINKFSDSALSFKTGEVAKKLGVSEAMLRYYCRVFEEFIGLETIKGEHRVFTEKEINRLDYIMFLLKVKRFTVNQVIEYLSYSNNKQSFLDELHFDNEFIKEGVLISNEQLYEKITNKLEYMAKYIEIIDKRTIDINEKIDTLLKKIEANGDNEVIENKEILIKNKTVNKRLADIDKKTKTKVELLEERMKKDKLWGKKDNKIT